MARRPARGWSEGYVPSIWHASPSPHRLSHEPYRDVSPGEVFVGDVDREESTLVGRALRAPERAEAREKDGAMRDGSAAAAATARASSDCILAAAAESHPRALDVSGIVWTFVCE